MELTPNKGAVGTSFRKEAKVVTEALSRLQLEDVATVEQALKEKG